MTKSPLENRSKHSYLEFRSFWEHTALSLPPFHEAPSTHYYFECECLLFQNFVPELKGKKILKTDLWDEAKNTRILNWAARQGAEVFGIDISFEILQEAKKSFAKSEERLNGVVSDLRDICYKDDTFNFIYSMGTIEHFHEYRQAIKECFRVIKKGGLAIFGVPNKYDPFLRPLMVSYMNKLGLYAYGEEKSFGMGNLENILREAGFRVVGRSGILFLPGWLRIADLLLHLRWPKTCSFIKPLIFLFSFLYKKFPFLRRHGYLIVCVVQKP